jgi:hypothetical protein
METKNQKEKWIKAISKLNRLTQEGKLEWSALSNGEVWNTSVDSTVSSLANKEAYYTRYKGRILIIYNKSGSVNALISGGPIGISGSAIPVDAKLLVKKEGLLSGSEWQLPDYPGIDDLFDSVRLQVSGAGGFADEILEGDD